MISLRRILILVVAAFLIWRIGVISLSSHYARSIVAGKDAALARGDQARTDALVKMALRLRPADP